MITILLARVTRHAPAWYFSYKSSSKKFLIIGLFIIISKVVFANADSVLLYNVFDSYIKNKIFMFTKCKNTDVNLVDIDLSGGNKYFSVSITRIQYKKEVASKPFQVYYYKNQYFLLSFKGQIMKNKAFDFSDHYYGSNQIPIDSVLIELSDRDELYTGIIYNTYVDHFSIQKFGMIHVIINRTYFPASVCPTKYQIDRVYTPELADAGKDFYKTSRYFPPKKIRQINRKHIKILCLKN